MPRRRMSKGRKSGRFQPRKRADWVYRGPPTAGFTGGAVEQAHLASYTEVISTLNTGPANAQMRVLYDSVDRMAEVSYGNAGTTPQLLNRSRRAEGRNPLILATEFQLYMEPTTWSVGQLIALGWRLGAFEQDPGTGLLSINASYSMWVNGGPGEDPAAFANVKNWVKEGRFFLGFSTDVAAQRNIHIRWRGRHRLRANEAWALYLESETTGVNLRTQPWGRALVVDES